MRKSFLTIMLLALATNAWALSIVKLGPEYFPENDRSRALANGYIYVGEPDLDPSIPANQKTLSIQQENGTIVAVTQPIRTSAGGVPIYSGSPVTLLVDGNYSLLAQNSLGAQEYYVPSLDGGPVANNLSDYGCNLDTMVAQVGAVVDTHVIIDCDPDELSADLTIPANITIEWRAGFTLGGPFTITINGDLVAGNYELFENDITVLGLGMAYPGWWTVNLSPGSTDMTTAIRNAISASSGNIKWFDNHYLVTDTITMTDDFQIIDHIKFTFSGSMAGKNILSAISSDNINIKNVTFVGDKTTQGSSGFGNAVAITSGKNITISNCNMSDLAQNGIWLKDCSNYSINGNVITSIGMSLSSPAPGGIRVTDESYHGDVFNNHISEIGTDSSNGNGITFIQQIGGTSLPTKTNVYGNHLENIYSHGIVFYSNDGPEIADANIFDNIIENTGLSTTGGIGNGIYSLWSRGMNIHDNVVKSPNTNTVSASILQGAIVVTGNDADIDRQLTISNNQIEDCGLYQGIYVFNVKTQILISGNEIKNCTNAEAIRVLDVQNFKIENNFISTATGQVGIRVLSNGVGAESKNGIVSGNIIDDCSFGVFILDAENVNVFDNFVTNQTANAYRFDNPTKMLVSRNSNTDNTLQSVYVSNGVGVIIKDNMFPSRPGYSYPYVFLSGDVLMDFYSDNAIIVSTWTVGSRAHKKTPVVGSPMGWMCTVSGTPGTWVEIGDL